jgi:hypothetical protein
MVSQYTECGLTYEKDIFPAFSGIAKAVGDVTGASFCAGIWSDDLARGLSWKRQPQSDWNGGISRTKSYQAPSFSWASCKGAVSYSNLGWDKDQDPGFILLCNYLTHQLYHSGDEYGPLSGGWLKVEAPIIPVKNIKHWIFDEPDCRSMHLIIVLKREPCQLCGSFDRNDGTSGKLFLLLLAKLDVDPPRPYEAIQSEFIFLIIRQLEVEAQPTFERVGSGRSCISLCDDHSAVVTGDREWNLAMERVEHQRNMKLQLLNMPKEIVTLV